MRPPQVTEYTGQTRIQADDGGVPEAEIELTLEEERAQEALDEFPPPL